MTMNVKQYGSSYNYDIHLLEKILMEKEKA